MKHPWKLTSIRTRLLLAYIGIILVGFSGLTLISAEQITAGVRADYESRLKNEVRLIAQGVAASLPTSGPNMNDEALLNLCNEYADSAGSRLQVFGMKEDEPRREPDDPAHRSSFRAMAEMETALRGEIVVVQRADESGAQLLYTAAPIQQGAQLRALLQLAVPVATVDAIVAERWAVLGAGFGLLTTLALLAAAWLSRSILVPLRKMREAAVHLSQGDLAHRAPTHWKDEFGEVARAFNEMAGEVQSMLEEQRAFASNTSHELRTPLTAIRLRTDALRHDPTLDAETARRYVEAIDQEVINLSNLVQDLTLISRFDAGRAELGHDEIDMSRLATSLCQRVADQVAEKGLRISVNTPPDPISIDAGLNHLTVMFRNLLDNAIKYTPAGGTITWTIRRVENGVEHLIQDTGQGIDARHLPRLFERFYRADRARSRDIPGTGLGLSLVQSIVAAYGGSIRIESAGIDRGTTVQVFLPARSSA